MATSFPDEIVELAWLGSGGKCECMDMARCRHDVWPHGLELRLEDRGKDSSLFGLEAHHADPTGPLDVKNCLILCMACHKNTTTYGSHP